MVFCIKLYLWKILVNIMKIYCVLRLLFWTVVKRKPVLYLYLAYILSLDKMAIKPKRKTLTNVFVFYFVHTTVTFLYNLPILIRPAHTVHVYRNHHVHPSAHMSCKSNSSLTDEPILMKLYTVAVYHLRMYMKEDYTRQEYLNVHI